MALVFFWLSYYFIGFFFSPLSLKGKDFKLLIYSKLLSSILISLL